MRFAVWMTFSLAGCVGATTKSEHSAATGDGACELAAASSTCPSCTDGPTTCRYGGVRVVEGSCGDCQARHALYQALCDAGNTDPAEDITEGAECLPSPCAWYYPGCSCEPVCGPVLSGSWSDAHSGASSTPCTPCYTPLDPVGTCAWNGAECAVTTP